MGEPPFNEVHPAIASVSVMIILDMPSSALHCTGQDRTGQDRTGQDRTGQDRTGQDKNGFLDRYCIFIDAICCWTFMAKLSIAVLDRW
jgi:hypothetical protein